FGIDRFGFELGEHMVHLIGDLGSRVQTLGGRPARGGSDEMGAGSVEFREPFVIDRKVEGHNRRRAGVKGVAAGWVGTSRCEEPKHEVIVGRKELFVLLKQVEPDPLELHGIELKLDLRVSRRAHKPFAVGSKLVGHMAEAARNVVDAVTTHDASIKNRYG